MRTILPIFIILLVSACAKERQDSVWDLYDVRHPVPEDSQVPVSQATQYDQYIDNDAYYQPPTIEQYDPD
ncbi:MAG: hypothetical protein J0M34_04615 [Alphaproteobacteria bacterium]|nr:hypothetical protein [Alphaproteobacteria bacterium]